MNRTITLRARRASGLAVGMLLGSPKGRVVYRVLEVTKVRRAGEVQSPRLRLVCSRLAPRDVPDGSAVHPWPTDRSAPRRTRQPAEIVRRRPPEMALVIAASRRADRGHDARHRVRQREHSYGVDVGPTLRLEQVSDADGQVLREADVTVITASDPARPQRRMRRAVRADPLLALHGAGSITTREFSAAETLRNCLESMTPPLGESGGVPVHMAAFLRKPISTFQIDAAQGVRGAAAALGPRHWEAVLWICLGGTVTGYSSYRRMRTATAGELVRDGMVKLADHFEGGRTACAP